MLLRAVRKLLHVPVYLLFIAVVIDEVAVICLNRAAVSMHPPQVLTPLLPKTSVQVEESPTFDEETWHEIRE